VNELSVEEILSRIALAAGIEAGLANDPDPRAPGAVQNMREQRVALEEELIRRGAARRAKAEERPAPGPNDVVIQLKPADLSAVPANRS
jgi:hypothetical protein